LIFESAKTSLICPIFLTSEHASLFVPNPKISGEVSGRIHFRCLQHPFFLAREVNTWNTGLKCTTQIIGALRQQKPCFSKGLLVLCHLQQGGA